MTSAEAKTIISAGLERRKTEQQMAAQEARLEQYEQEQIRTCNEHSADAKAQRQKEETGRINRELLEARRAEKARAIAEAKAKEDAAFTAAKRFCYSSLGIAMVATWTPMEWWAAAALIAGLAVFPAAYVFRLYYRINENNS